MTFILGPPSSGRLLPLMDKLSVQPLLYGGVEHDPGQEHLDGSIVVFFTRPEVK